MADTTPLRASQEAIDASSQPEITGFQLSLHNFTGPFDLLLHLINRRTLDITEIALAEVTDEFISYTKQLGEVHDRLDETTEFVLIASTLLSLKAARLLPHSSEEEIDDAEILEMRDLLFARLLQYRAYKKVADLFAEWQRSAQRRYPRAVALEQHYAELLPPVHLGLDAEGFAQVAAGVFRPRPPEEVSTSHLHFQPVSVPEQAGKLLGLLKFMGVSQWASFTTLTADCGVSMEIVGRFLALLELYKAQALQVEQKEALGELRVAWTGKDVDPAVVAAANWS
ncbi:Segregation and condensation protein A [Corynebacterium ciconiae DSM 44920]|uniref:segregation and condensation protein A n=1 Tax=Corynebacterium ciconiae TaxID=227319 RepID=UPI00039FF6A4|nr:segregation/condensation protein A [Corynebacterium ciconiae]WKD61122.1 Segregation and condensation protein A [Corynebacterium ciconiae DSM 44920]